MQLPSTRTILPRLGSSPRIAVLKGGGIGDFLAATPAFRALRAAMPGARITLLTTPYLEVLARRCEVFDDVVIVPPYPGVCAGLPNGDELDAFFGQMQARRFDLALQMHGGGSNSNPFVLRLGAALTAGFQAVDAPDLELSLPYDLHRHEVLRWLDLTTLLGVPAPSPRLEFPLQTSDFDALRDLRESVDLPALADGQYLGIHATAGAPSRRWAPEHFAIVADQLLDEFDLAGVVVTAGPGQEEDSARVLRAMRHRDRAVDVGGRLSLGSLGALISQLRLYLTNDSGPSHIAVALGTPSVVVFGSGNPVIWAPLDQTWHRVVADWTAPCRWFAPDGCADASDVPCLRAIGPEQVLEAARQLLEMSARVDRARANISHSTAGAGADKFDSPPGYA